MGVDPVDIGNRSRAVFLDRDGVINKAILRSGRPFPPASLSELEILPGVYNALNELVAARFYLIVVTNQPDVARGTQSREKVEEINNLLQTRLPLNLILSCYHDDADQCNCRKPKPGLILEAAQRFNIDLAGSFMVGDRWKDIEAGRRAGCQTVFIDYDYPEREPETPTYKVRSLAEAVRVILQAGKGL